MLPILLIVAAAVAVNAQPSLYVSRIVGGRTSNIKEFPYQVSLEYFGSFTCGGSILSPYYILTAAHCVHGRTNPVKYLKVRAGSSMSGQGGSLHHLAGYEVHEKYYVNNYQNTGFDVAVLKLQNPIEYDETRQPIAPAGAEQKYPKAGTFAVASGWGRLKHNGPLPKQLQSVKLAVVDYEECRKLYKDLGGLEEGELCVKSPGSMVQGVCNGDSGGPLVIDGKLAGIAAHSENCAGLGYPDVFTEVAHFRKWIDEHVEY